MEIVASDPDTRIEEHDMNFAIEGNVDDLYEEMVLVPLANSSHITVEVKMELDAGFAASKDNEKDLKEIEELMNTVRGSIVGDPHRNLVVIAKEAFKTAVAQMATQKDDCPSAPDSGSTSTTRAPATGSRMISASYSSGRSV